MGHQETRLQDRSRLRSSRVHLSTSESQCKDEVLWNFGGGACLQFVTANMPRIRRGGTFVRVELNQAAYRPGRRSPAE
jgi:hypothetical protein